MKNFHQLHVAILMGSTREGRLCDKVTRWVAAQLEAQADLALDVIDPATLDLPRQHSREAHPGVRALRERIGKADAFLVVTPKYNHGYPAPLKFVIDSVHDEWQAKPVGFVSYGGISGGLRAGEQLRLVFAELHAVTVRDTVSFADAWNQFNGTGELRNPSAAEGSMAKLMSMLRWWGHALRFARSDVPYGEVRRPVGAAVPEDHEGPVVVINTFTPKAGQLDAFIAAQVADQKKALVANVPGFRGSRFHRAIDGTNAIGMAVFDSVRDHRRWLENARFAEHLDNIAPFLERADPRYYTVVFEVGSLQPRAP